MNTMNNKKEKLARLGIATKGGVYCLIGILAAMSALGMGGKKTGTSGALEYLSGQIFGQVLLFIVAIGLIGYVFWRSYQAIWDPEDIGSDLKGVATRVGLGSSAVFYGFLAFTAIKIALGSGSGSSDNGNESVVASLLGETYGQILVGILGAVFLGKAVYQFWMAYSGKFNKKVKNTGLNQKAKKLILTSGKVGYTARGIVIGIVSFLTFKAAFTANSSDAGGTKDAFQFLQNEFGTIVLIVIAAGLIAYGVFMCIKARYREMSSV